MDRGQLKYILRRLHSLSGILPLAVFMGEHYFTNAHALGGAQSFDEAVNNLHSIPFLWAMEIFVVLLPLLYHAVYGLFITRESHLNTGSYPQYQNIAYTAQRVTGVLLILFVGMHFYETRLQDIMHQWGIGGEKVDYAYMVNYFGAGWVKAIYVVGLAAIAFHLGNGLSLL